ADGGHIRLGDRDIAGLAPKDRGIAFVFQSYALYPHMTARDNIATPLRQTQLSGLGRVPGLWRASPAARRARAGIDDEVARVARMLDLAPHLDRRPGHLSGGQQQRVALGRALIRQPDLFLLDEPLANLDAALRNRTRTELRALQRRVGATTLFVTHDQGEAMALSDRIAILFDGRLRQFDTPDALFRDPVDIDVARFLAQPHLNEVPADRVRAHIGAATSERDIAIGGAPLAGAEGLVAFRPEDATIRTAARPGLPGLPARVEFAEHAGHDAMLFVRLDPGGERVVIRIPSHAMADWPEGARGIVHFDLGAARLYPGATPLPVQEAAA
ncbi:MAG: ABC transporter ATP-binding protein, partial [Shimia sp.]